jgi:hypothetical protein
MNVSGSCVLSEIEDRAELTEEFWELRQKDAIHLEITLLVIIYITGVPLNAWIIARIVKKKLHTEPTYMLLLNLAVTDLLVCLIPVFLNIIFQGIKMFSFGGSDYVRCQVCKIAVIYVILNFQTIYNLTLISLDRFAYFKLSIKYNRYVTTQRTVVALIVIWALSLLMGIPPLVGYGDIVFSAGCGMVFSRQPHVKRSYSYIGIGLITQVVGITILIITNIWILYIGLKQVHAMRIQPEPRPDEHRLSLAIDVHSTVKQVKLFQIFGGILLVHFFTLLPATILVGMIIASNNIPPVVYRLVLLTLFAAAPLHPLVEAFFTPELKHMFRKYCKICHKSRRPSESVGLPAHLHVL